MDFRSVTGVFQRISENFRRMKDLPKGFKRFQKSSRGSVSKVFLEVQGFTEALQRISGDFGSVLV